MARIKLFSQPEENVREYICKDCGTVVTSASNGVHLLCPNCGGKRFDVKLFKSVDRKNIFESPYEKNLKEFGGKTISKNTFEKTFSTKADDMIEKRFATVDGDSVSISKDAYGIEKLFSKLTISVTKTLELDSDIMGGCNKESVIDQLPLPKKSIILIRKAHGIPEEPIQHIFSENEGCEENWIEDSSIIPDLQNEYNNQSFGIMQFVNILKNRYPDAPEDILDILANKGVIRIENNKITID